MTIGGKIVVLALLTVEFEEGSQLTRIEQSMCIPGPVAVLTLSHLTVESQELGAISVPSGVECASAAFMVVLRSWNCSSNRVRN
jgi:hypothetical protein